MSFAGVAVVALAALATPTVEATHRPTLDRTERNGLRYELKITNPSSAPVIVSGLRIGDGQGRSLAVLSGEALLAASDRPSNSGGPVKIAPNVAATLFIDIDLPDRKAPLTLEHVVDFTGGEATVTSPVDGTEPVVLGPPLRGGPWVAVHSPVWPRGHRRVFYTEGGRASLPGRYAIDFVGVDARGSVTRDDADVPADAIGYGAEVIAVADGLIDRVRDGMAESQSIVRNPDHRGPDAAGNHVVLKLATGRYAFYEHLRPGSIAVRAGQRVRRGEVIGALGFTGDSTGPHLHFHVADAPSPLGGEGLPFVIDGFQLCGRYTDIAGLGRSRWSAGTPRRVRGERPSTNVVVTFDGACP